MFVVLIYSVLQIILIRLIRIEFPSIYIIRCLSLGVHNYWIILPATELDHDMEFENDTSNTRLFFQSPLLSIYRSPQLTRQSMYCIPCCDDEDDSFYVNESDEKFFANCPVAINIWKNVIRQASDRWTSPTETFEGVCFKIMVKV